MNELINIQNQDGRPLSVAAKLQSILRKGEYNARITDF